MYKIENINKVIVVKCANNISDILVVYLSIPVIME